MFFRKFRWITRGEMFAVSKQNSLKFKMELSLRGFVQGARWAWYRIWWRRSSKSDQTTFLWDSEALLQGNTVLWVWFTSDVAGWSSYTFLNVGEAATVAKLVVVQLEHTYHCVATDKSPRKSEVLSHLALRRHHEPVVCSALKLCFQTSSDTSNESF